METSFRGQVPDLEPEPDPEPEPEPSPTEQFLAEICALFPDMFDGVEAEHYRGMDYAVIVGNVTGRLMCRGVDESTIDELLERLKVYEYL